jgi:hypothetical protein
LAGLEENPVESAKDGQQQGDNRCQEAERRQGDPKWEIVEEVEHHLVVDLVEQSDAPGKAVNRYRDSLEVHLVVVQDQDHPK